MYLRMRCMHSYVIVWKEWLQNMINTIEEVDVFNQTEIEKSIT